jgi:hypothetical protein
MDPKWLEDRQQTVVPDGVSSEAVSVDSGLLIQDI